MAFFLLLLCGAFALGCTSKQSPDVPLVKGPPLVLWAWYKHQDLRFINPKTTGVAFAARTITVGEVDVSIKHRTQPFLVPENTHITGVIRIELHPAANADAFKNQLSNIVDNIVTVSHQPSILGIQIDFDAPKSFRPIYLLLLQEIQKKIPGEMELSITALSSWCLYDRWLKNAPIDKVVPMMFAMGKQSQNALAALATEKQFLAPLCQGQIGIATNEPMPHIPSNSQVYVFSPGTWQESTYIQSVDNLRDYGFLEK